MVAALLLAGLLSSSALAAPALRARDGSAGCGKSHSFGYKTNGGSGYSVESSGGTRTYNLYLPKTYDANKPMGVIISYHGNGGSSDGQYQLSQFGNEDWNPNLMSVYPQGKDGHWEGPTYADEGVDDVQFTKDLLDHLRSEYCVDDTRIYASGKSNGGGFVDTLACSDASSQFAAFSACSGAFYTDNNDNSGDCKPARQNIPFLEFHGSNDGTISYDGVSKDAGTTPPIPDWIKRWGDRNGCSGSNNDFSQSQVNHTVFSDCPNSAVEAYWIEGMDHSWPSTSDNSDNQAHGDGPTVLDATPLIIDFYNKFTL